MDSFEVVNYKISTDFRRANDGKNIITRVLEMDSVTMYHGIVMKVHIGFSSSWNNWANSSVGFYNTNQNGYGATIIGWFPLHEYENWLDIVRHEKPVHFHYNIREINGAKYINHMKLSTTSEPLGEGLFEMESLKKVMKEALQET